VSPEELYASGMLDPDIHGRLVSDITQICIRAGIPGLESLIGRPLSENCIVQEVRWMEGFWNHAGANVYGLIYEGRVDPPVERRFPAMIACLLRNFVDARMVSMQDLLSEDSDADICTALFLPNLYRGKNDGGYFPPATVQRIYDILMRRIITNKQTIVHVSLLSDLKIGWGNTFHQLLFKNYVGIG